MVVCIEVYAVCLGKSLTGFDIQNSYFNHNVHEIIFHCIAQGERGITISLLYL